MSPKIVLTLVFVVLLVGAWFYNNRTDNASSNVTTSMTNEALTPPARGVESNTDSSINTQNDNTASQVMTKSLDEDYDDMDDDPIIPASQKYKTSQEAINAIKQAAIDYDDFVLEEFVQLTDCTWCSEVYKEVTALLNDPSVSIDQRGFYGELLAVSGDLDNIKVLANGITEAKNDEERDMFAESLEMAIGSDDMTSYLGQYLSNSNEVLRESAVAAISNQGSRLAAETLYNDMLNGMGKDEDYYSLGIGLGEMVPDDDALPFLQDLVIKRAPHSDLAVKALINNGLAGLTIVFDSLASEQDETKGKAMLVDAIDHVITEDGVEKFLTTASQNSNYPPFLRDFAKQALEENADDDMDDFDLD